MSQSTNENLVFSSTGDYDDNFTYKEMEIGPKFWFINNYYLFVNIAYESFVFHVGDIKYDPTKNLKIKVQIPK